MRNGTEAVTTDKHYRGAARRIESTKQRSLFAVQVIPGHCRRGVNQPDLARVAGISRPTTHHDAPKLRWISGIKFAYFAVKYKIVRRATSLPSMITLHRSLKSTSARIFFRRALTITEHLRVVPSSPCSTRSLAYHPSRATSFTRGGFPRSTVLAVADSVGLLWSFVSSADKYMRGPFTTSPAVIF